MAHWAVGDVQGCFGAFRRLLARIDFRDGRDRISFVGDLVNRGPDSLGMLRWARDHGDCVESVLGNHDLHLLAQAAGVRKPAHRDTLKPILDAPDGPELCDWLARRPFLLEADGHVVVHAGIPPAWSLGEAARRAQAAEAALRTDRRRFLRELYRVRARADGTGEAAETASVLTRLRAVDRSGEPVFGFDGTPEDLPPGARTWFEARRPEGPRVVFGHWAALGLVVAERAIGLDSGCVWGAFLTAMRLEDGAFAFEPALPGEGLSVS